MRTPVFTILPAILMLGVPSLWAEAVTFESPETPVTLVELFTSEGCSSCPPADAWVSKLKGNPDLWKRIVPVVFHVDYWNGLGWPDRFATAENTARQRRYAATWGTDSVYTPGVVLNGREWRDWYGRSPWPEPSSTKVGKLTVTVREKQIDVAFAGSEAISAPGRQHAGTVPSLLVEVAFLSGHLESDVTRGENGGRKLQHDFTVLQLLSASLHTEGGSGRASLPIPAKFATKPAALAAWVSPAAGQPPIQATGGWLPGR